MKMHFDRFSIFFSLFFLLIIGGCFSPIDRPKPKEPAKPSLPPETQTGANTFGCYVNGNLWLPGGEGIAGNGITWSHSYHDQIGITGRKAFQQDGKTIIEDIGIGVLDGLTGVGEYQLVGNGRIGEFIQSHPGCVMKTDSLNTGILEITRWDMELLIVSGRFSFTLTAPGCDTIRVTDGCFDVKL